MHTTFVTVGRECWLGLIVSNPSNGNGWVRIRFNAQGTVKPMRTRVPDFNLGIVPPG